MHENPDLAVELGLHEPTGHPPTWLFGIINIPFGVSGGYVAVAMPFLLRQAGLSVEVIADNAALALVPSFLQLFWAPVIDIGIRRRAWLIIMSVLGAICLYGAVLVDVKHHLRLFEVLMVLGQVFCGLVASCVGALVSVTLPDKVRGAAAGWVNAGNLGAAVLGGGMVLTLYEHVSPQAAALGLALAIILPSLVALCVPEPPPARENLWVHLCAMASEVWRAVSARRGWTGLLFCVSPVGTAALTNLFSGMAPDYHASNRVIEFVNGYAGGLVTAAGALISGWFLDRVDRRLAYLVSGALTAVCAFAMTLGPLNQTTFIVGCLAYLLVTGLCYAAFSAVVYEIVGTAGKTASTLYSVFPAAGNLAIAYVVALDGKGNGARGVLYNDAMLNIAGIVALLFLLRIVFPPTPQERDVVNPS